MVGGMGIQPFNAEKKEKMRQEVVQLYQAGLTYREIAAKLGISHETARQMYLSTPIERAA